MGAIAAHLGGRQVIVVGLAVYTAGLWLLSDVSAMSAVPGDVLGPSRGLRGRHGHLHRAVGGRDHEGTGRRRPGHRLGGQQRDGATAGLLAIIVLPALAGLAGAGSLDAAVLAEAYPKALRAAAVIAIGGIPVALLTLSRRTDPKPAHARS